VSERQIVLSSKFPLDTPPTVAIFDLDGTLFHSAPGITNCINTVLEADGRRRISLAEATAMIGDGALMLVSRAYEATGGAPVDSGGIDSRHDAFVDLLTEVSISPKDLYPGVRETLIRLADANVPMALCTNKPEDAARHALIALEIGDFFDIVVGGDSLPERKPHALPMLSILERLGTTPDRAVMVGDSANDLNTARAAGVGCILVSFGYSRDPINSLGAEIVVDKFSDVSRLLLPG
jgi:phosphoglycolate phosphatase